MADLQKNILEEIRTKIRQINELSNLSIEGAWIVIETGANDFSTAQLSHLIEQNNARIVNLFSYIDEASSRMFVGIKINLEDAEGTVRALERFDYDVKYYIQQQRLSDETMRDRYNELIHYLEI